tara:strand:- start:1499 stop:1741 length:243 start_codon:yes stop_codon:yes gene_type:complete
MPDNTSWSHLNDAIARSTDDELHDASERLYKLMRANGDDHLMWYLLAAARDRIAATIEYRQTERWLGRKAGPSKVEDANG